MLFVSVWQQKPFLPKLSANILGFFTDVLNDEQAGEIYRGNLDVLNDIFVKGHKITGTVEALVPKIPDELIAEKLSSYQAKLKNTIRHYPSLTLGIISLIREVIENRLPINQLKSDQLMWRN